jgi:hypothetical protein
VLVSAPQHWAPQHEHGRAIVVGGIVRSGARVGKGEFRGND